LKLSQQHQQYYHSEGDEEDEEDGEKARALSSGILANLACHGMYAVYLLFTNIITLGFDFRSFPFLPFFIRVSWTFLSFDS
jgi:hypothetical protein